MGTYRKLILILIILVCANLAAPHLFSAIKENHFEIRTVPLKVKGWKGSPFTVKQRVKDILETENVYQFSYGNKGDFVELSVVYYPKGRIAFHMPEGCTVGAGEKIIFRDSIQLPGAWGDTKAVYFKVEDRMGNITDHAYVFATHRKAMGSYIFFRLHLLAMGITEKVQSCALIRLSVHENRDNGTEKKIMMEFWKDISPFLKTAISEDTTK